MKITCTVNDAEFKSLCTTLRQRMGNLRPVMEEIGQRYERRVLENFDRQQAPDGTPWRPAKVVSNYLSYVGTAKGGKRRSAYTQGGQLRTAFQRFLASKKLLVLSGRLRSRIHYQADNGSVRIGVAGIEYAAIHQFGGQAGRGRKVTIPARPFLAVNSGGQMALAEQDRVMVMDVVRKHLGVASL
jgi:phage gpG-like protein